MASILTFAVLLGTPLLGALLLGLLGANRWAPALNVAFSLLTFVAACALTSRVITHGNLLVMQEQFFIDAFNVFLVTLTAFVGLTTSLFSRPYMRIEAEHGRVSSAQLRLYHSMYQLFIATMLIALTTNNLGLMWVAMEAATLSTVLLVTLYRTPASLEVLHFVRRGHCAGTVRHDPLVLRCGEDSRRRGSRRAAVDASQRREGATRARGAQPGVRILAGWVRH